MENNQCLHIKLLRLPQVVEKIGLKRSQIYLLMGEGRFPKPLRLGPRAVAWRLDEIDEWIRQLPRSI
ncbi:MAG: AlpA family transcriptional regulator [Desulfobulbia bacterium]